MYYVHDILRYSGLIKGLQQWEFFWNILLPQYFNVELSSYNGCEPKTIATCINRKILISLTAWAINVRASCNCACFKKILPYFQATTSKFKRWENNFGPSVLIGYFCNIMRPKTGGRKNEWMTSPKLWVMATGQGLIKPAKWTKIKRNYLLFGKKY